MQWMLKLRVSRKEAKFAPLRETLFVYLLIRITQPLLMHSKKIVAWALIMALGGFLFGFDTAVISGAEQAIQKYWNLDKFQHGLTVAIALIGTVIGALIGGIPADRLGRKNTLIIIAALYFFSSIGTALATNWYLFLLFRLLGGLGVGASSVTAPIYISEIAPAASRGRLVALFQLNVVLGILIAYFSNWVIGTTHENSWRWMLGVQAIPSLAFFLLMRIVPESPRWLILKGKKPDEARRTMQIIDPVGFEKDLAEIKETTARQSGQPSQPLFSKANMRPVLLAICFAFFNQVSGINAIIYFAPRIFEMSGLGENASLLSSVGIGLVNFLFTLLAINFIDRFGRRSLMLIGSLGLIATLGMASYAFYHSQSGWSVIAALLIYIAFFAFSQGAVIWVFLAEIFPNQVRAKGQSLGSFTHWIMAAAITFTFPYFAENYGGGPIFLFFCSMMVLQLIFVLKFMHETKGKSLEQLEHQLVVH